MNGAIRARLNRWVDIGILAGAGSLFIALCGASIFNLVDSFILKTCDPDNYFSGLTYLSIALFLAIGFIHYFLRTKLKHLICWKYPSLLVAVLISFLLAPLWPIPFQATKNIFINEWWLAVVCALVYGGVWFLHSGIFYLLERYTPQSEGNESELTRANVQVHQLIAWLFKDDPIEKQTLDFFDHNIVAARLAKRLEGGAQSIALLGAYGAGKSSVCEMLKEKSEASNRPYIFVTVSSWGFSSSDRVQGILLETVLERIAEEVDCFKLRSLPDHYIKAIGGYHSWLDTLLKLASHKTTPLRQIQRLSPILSAIDKRVIVVIEDLDRNQEGFRLSQIQALLMQLKQVKEISFILAISPSQDVDFLKVCNYLELIEDLPRHRILEIVDQLRTLFLETSRGIILTEPIPSLVIGEEHLVNRDRSLSYHYPRERCLFSLLNTPRKLRATMLRVYTVWDDLQGEVRIDDLISMCTLRIAAPEAFRYFQKNWTKIGALRNERNAEKFVKEGNQKICDQLMEEWVQSLSGAEFDSQAAAELICTLCPEFASVIGRTSSHQRLSQSMAKESRRAVYAKRLFSESVAEDSVKDQDILQCIQNSLIKRKYLTRLAEAITDSEPAADAFADFSVVKNFRQHLDLLSEICKVIKQRHGSSYHHHRHYGFIQVWNIIERGQQDHVNEWIRQEIVACIPRYLNLANELYSAWVRLYSQNSDDRKAIRFLMLCSLKESWEDADTMEVEKAFDPLHPYTLFHLIYTPDYEQEGAVHFGKIEDWAWLGPIMWRGCQEKPSVFIPQVVILLGLNDLRGRIDVPRYEFNKEAVGKFFGDEARSFYELVSSEFDIPDGLSEQTVYLLELAKSHAESLLESLNGSDEIQLVEIEKKKGEE